MTETADYWADIVGQQAAVAQLEHVLSPAGANDLSHAWLITGPPGSGRSNLAYLFAAALIARSPQERQAVYHQVRQGTHPDIEVLTTDGVLITIEQARRAATRAHYAPSQGRYRVIIAEDADRLPERSSNTLLKVLEEPPEKTIWILCAPSEADMLPTIRSRTRALRLSVPSTAEVADLLQSRDGVMAATASQAARLAQSHIGMARKLALDEAALERRQLTLEAVLEVATLSDAMSAAGRVIKLAEADAEAMSKQYDERERQEMLNRLGVQTGATVPLALRGQLKQLEEAQKRRQKRSLHDAIDRVFVDLLSLYRDALLLSLGANTELINQEFEAKLIKLTNVYSSNGLNELVTAVTTARERLGRNVSPALTVEAMLAAMIYVRGR